MTFVLLGLGGLACLLGTRLAALAFVAAAIFAATHAPVTAPVTWTAALAAGWLVITNDAPRRLALPALGAAAALAAGATGNAAAVLGLTVMSTAAAAATTRLVPGVRRWCLFLAATDVLVAISIWSVLPRALEGWPGTLHARGAVLLFVAGAAKALLAAGPDDAREASGLLAVRAQAVVLLMVSTAQLSPGSLRAAVVALSLGLVASRLARRDATRDVLREASFAAMALATARLGWGPSGWVWGALAAGTLTHYLRLKVRTSSRPLPAVLHRSAAASGIAFLPVVAAEIEGAAKVRGWLGAVVLVGAAAALLVGGRPSEPVATALTRRRLDTVRVVLLVGAIGVASLWAGSMTLPDGAAGAAIPWPPAWTIALVSAAAVIGSRFSGFAESGSAGERIRAAQLPLGPVGPVLEAIERWSVPVVVVGVIGVLSVVAAAFWVVGFRRGFL